GACHAWPYRNALILLVLREARHTGCTLTVQPPIDVAPMWCKWARRDAAGPHPARASAECLPQQGADAVLLDLAQRHQPEAGGPLRAFVEPGLVGEAEGAVAAPELRGGLKEAQHLAVEGPGRHAVPGPGRQYRRGGADQLAGGLASHGGLLLVSGERRWMPGGASAELRRDLRGEQLPGDPAVQRREGQGHQGTEDHDGDHE